MLATRPTPAIPPGATWREEWIRCSKPTCACRASDGGERHGPYWYAYWRGARGELHKRYGGKERPDERSGARAKRSTEET